MCVNITFKKSIQTCHYFLVDFQDKCQWYMISIYKQINNCSSYFHCLSFWCISFVCLFVYFFFNLAHLIRDNTSSLCSSLRPREGLKPGPQTSMVKILQLGTVFGHFVYVVSNHFHVLHTCRKFQRTWLLQTFIQQTDRRKEGNSKHLKLLFVFGKKGAFCRYALYHTVALKQNGKDGDCLF